MRIPLREEPWQSPEIGPRPCPVCGELWRPWVGSFLPCHARCLFTDEEQDALLEENATRAAQARRLGVTVSVIQAALSAARRRR